MIDRRRSVIAIILIALVTWLLPLASPASALTKADCRVKHPPRRCRVIKRWVGGIYSSQLRTRTATGSFVGPYLKACDSRTVYVRGKNPLGMTEITIYQHQHWCSKNFYTWYPKLWKRSIWIESAWWWPGDYQGIVAGSAAVSGCRKGCRHYALKREFKVQLCFAKIAVCIDRYAYIKVDQGGELLANGRLRFSWSSGGA